MLDWADAIVVEDSAVLASAIVDGEVAIETELDGASHPICDCLHANVEVAPLPQRHSIYDQGLRRCQDVRNSLCRDIHGQEVLLIVTVKLSQVVHARQGTRLSCCSPQGLVQVLGPDLLLVCLLLHGE